MAEVTLDNVSKVYPNGFQAVTDLSLQIQDGEFLVLVGPSGCGKSTALRMIAGLEEISSGEMLIGDRLVNKLPPKDRDIAMVFQNYALYPHMTVFDNIAFALKLAKVPKDDIKTRVHEAAGVLELEQHLDRKPAQLSGGQRQRVAMGRAIVRQPSAFLMDEPLSNLDAKLRVQMRAEIARIQQKLGVTTFYVTHDQVEAMTMADRVAVIDKGVLQQVDSPQTLYDEPNNLFVAAFIGSPAMNVFEGTITDNGGLAVELGSLSIGLPDALIAKRPSLRAKVNQPLIVGVRPEDLEDASLRPGHPADQMLTARVDLIEALGAELLVHLVVDATAVSGVFEPEAPEGLHLADGEGSESVAVGRFNPRSQVSEGDTIPVAVDAERLHFFDTASGEAIRQ